MSQILKNFQISESGTISVTNIYVLQDKVKPLTPTKQDIDNDK